jgi:hypothetical protein
MGLSRCDRAAMRLAIEQARASDEGRAQQIDAKLKTEPFEKAGRFAAYACQHGVLNAAPWQRTPSMIEPTEIAAIVAAPDDGSGKRDAAQSKPPSGA